MIKSMILYCIDPLCKKEIIFKRNDYSQVIIGGQELLIRSEIVDVCSGDALDLANPREHEIVLNAITLFDDKVEDVYVEIQYFKPSGKYYTEGYVSMPKNTPIHKAVEQIKTIFRKGEMPGMNGYEPTFNAYISFSELDCGYPVLLQYHE